MLISGIVVPFLVRCVACQAVGWVGGGDLEAGQQRAGVEVLADEVDQGDEPIRAERGHRVGIEVLWNLVVADQGGGQAVGDVGLGAQTPGCVTVPQGCDRGLGHAGTPGARGVGVERVLGPPLGGHGEDDHLTDIGRDVGSGDRLGPLQQGLSDARVAQHGVERADQPPVGQHGQVAGPFRAAQARGLQPGVDIALRPIEGSGNKEGQPPAQSGGSGGGLLVHAFHARNHTPILKANASHTGYADRSWTSR
ncbi:hypothetical protein [Nocardia niigatensis]